MALSTLENLGSSRTSIIAPEGPLVSEAQRRGHNVIHANGLWQQACQIERLIRSHSQIVFFNTSVAQALAIDSINSVYRRQIASLHVVHGGSDAHSSYGRKKLLNQGSHVLVAVSNYVRNQLVTHGVSPQKVKVVKNFLDDNLINGVRRRKWFRPITRGRGIVVSRLVSHKRIDHLFDTLEKHHELSGFSFDIYGDGALEKQLRERSSKSGLPVCFKGYCDVIPQRLADYDFMLHLNPAEPFGLVILEAMAARIPVLVPDQGGAAEIVEHQENGFVFTSGSTSSLAKGLLDLRNCKLSTIERVTSRAATELETQYSSTAQSSRYRRLISDLFCGRKTRIQRTRSWLNEVVR